MDNREALLRAKVAARPYELLVDDELVTVKVRGLILAEALDVQGKSKADDRRWDTEPADMDDAMVRAISIGLVDPAMSYDELSEWAKTAPSGTINELHDEIARLSGVGARAQKEAYKSLRG